MTSACGCGNEPLGYIQCGEFFFISRRPVRFSRRTLLDGDIYITLFYLKTVTSHLPLAR